MNQTISASFRSRADAERAALELIARGVPETSIQVEAVGPDSAPAEGPSLGGGVPVEAAEALVEAHDGEAAGDGVLLTVDTMGDPNREAASREVLGYMA